MSMSPRNTPLHLFEAEEPCEMDFNALDELLEQFGSPKDMDEHLKSLEEPSQNEKVNHCTHDMNDAFHDSSEFLKDIQLPKKDFDDLPCEFLKDLEPPQNELSPSVSLDPLLMNKVPDDDQLLDFKFSNMLVHDDPAVIKFEHDNAIFHNFNQLVSSPVSVDHRIKEEVVDIALDVTPSKLNNIRLPNNKKNGRWSKEEQRLFLIGLEKYGKGRWKDISEHVVLTRTSQQVASHAQKYIIRQNASKEKKKRKSIHDTVLLPKIDQGNYDFTPGFATLQPQEVQLSYNMPHQMRGVEYHDVDPHYIQQQNWVPSPFQPYPRKVYDISGLFSPNPMSGYRYVNNEFLNGRSYGMTWSKQRFF